MKSILLIGLGRFGRHIAMKLDELHHQVMAKDHDISGNGNCRQVFTGTGECFIWKGKSRRNSRIYRIYVKNTGNMVTFMLY